MAKLPQIFREPVFGLSTNRLREMARMQRQMDHLFDDLWGNQPMWEEMKNLTSFTPSCDLDETGTHYLMSFDLPGVKKEDIKIELQDNTLTVSGERKQETEKKDKNSYQSERFYGSFSRSFTVPQGTKVEQIETDYKDGVLKIALPKAETAKSQQIKIGEGKPGFWDKLVGHKKEENKSAPQPQEKRPAADKVA